MNRVRLRGFDEETIGLVGRDSKHSRTIDRRMVSDVLFRIFEETRNAFRTLKSSEQNFVGILHIRATLSRRKNTGEGLLCRMFVLSFCQSVRQREVAYVEHEKRTKQCVFEQLSNRGSICSRVSRTPLESIFHEGRPPHA